MLLTSLIDVPVLLAITAWFLVWRTKTSLASITKAALILSSAASTWAAILLWRMHLHPEYQRLPPWKDPINLGAGLLGLVAPIGIILGLVAAARGARWWLVALVELICFPLAFLGCAAAASV
jgi:hypothetical protein